MIILETKYRHKKVPSRSQGKYAEPLRRTHRYGHRFESQQALSSAGIPRGNLIKAQGQQLWHGDVAEYLARKYKIGDGGTE
nr:MAG TPA: hypothetical protein [Caudoviricetes sp.]